MDRAVARLNIEYYRRLPAIETDEVRRKTSTSFARRGRG